MARQSIKMIVLILQSVLFAWVAAAINTNDPRRDLSFLELAKYDGYNANAHYLTTEDGYILTVFRLPPKVGCQVNNTKPVIFMHGLYLSGDDCLIPGPNVAHCYIYADNCYDVWVPNSRGTFYSRNHTKLNPDKDSEFWNFSVDEMALYDTPVVIDYVLNKTGAQNVTFIGHSQGAAALILLCAKLPEYNKKIHIGIGLSTTAWLYNSKFVVISVESALSPFLTTASNNNMNVEILARGGITSNIARILCGSSDLSYNPCSTLIFSLLGYNEYQITPEVLKVITGHMPAGTSSKNFDRWGQIKKNGFTEFDYGRGKNVKIYGQAIPPEIDLGKVTMKWVFIGSENDYVSDLRDLDILISKLPNASTFKCVLSNKLFGHLDFVYGKDIAVYITPIVLSLLSDGSYECT